MTASIVIIAQKFCMEHFCDNELKMDSYMSIIDSSLEQFNRAEEKIQFLVEVRRIGMIMLQDAAKQLEQFQIYQLPAHAS